MHPYRSLPHRAFWSRSVTRGFDAKELLPSDTCLIRAKDRVASAGSCFASNLVPYLERQGIQYLRTEPRHPILADIPGENLGYDNFSAAYGNLYTARQLLQLLRRSLERFQPVEDRWITAQGVIDPFRPGLRYHARSERELELLTAQHLRAVRRLFEAVDVFVFTLGLTEAWTSRADGAVFPACPGTVAGSYDSDRHAFVNFGVAEVISDLSAFWTELREVNKEVRMVLTVSPVPLIATVSGEHVLSASIYSKSVLRVAAQEVARISDDIQYFPSYEIVTGPQAEAGFFERDLRSVSPRAVDCVMEAFLSHCESTAPKVESAPAVREVSPAVRTERASELSRRIAEAECEEAMADSGRGVAGVER